MDDINTPLGAADQALAFTVAWFGNTPFPQTEETKMMLGVLRDVIHHIDRSHIIMTDLAHAASLLLDVAEGSAGRGVTYGSAMFACRQAAAKFELWRAGRAYDVFKQQLAETAA